MVPTPEALSCAVYRRVSAADDRLSVDRQTTDTHRLAQARGWRVDPALDFEDNDISGRGKKVRPGFDALLAAIAEGKVTRLIATEWERIERNRKDCARFMEVAVPRGVHVALVRGADMDLASPAGRLVADVLSSIARHEVEQKEARQASAMEQKLGKGQRWGGRRPFGYTTKMEPLEPEAQAVREGYRLLLAGASLASVARHWNGLGLTTPQGPRGGAADDPHNPWTQGSMRRCMSKACYGGLRSHKGVIVGEAAWTGLIDRPTWEAAQHILNGRPRGPVAGVALVTGIARCGLCGATVHLGGRDRGLGPIYRCSRTPHMNQDQSRVEGYVEEMMLVRLARPEVARILAPEGPDLGPLRREAEQLRGRRDDLADDLALDEVTLARRVRAINARLEEISGVEAAAARSSRLAKLAASVDPGAEWLASDQATKRAALDALLEIKMYPPGRGTRTFRPETVKITPR